MPPIVRRNTVWFDQGVIWDPRPVAEDGFRRVCELFFQKRKDLFVLSGKDGDHLPHSFHYVGLAWDQRGSGISKAELLFVLGEGWQVVSYAWGHHIEFDPR